jgi:hypothetical protein
MTTALTIHKEINKITDFHLSIVAIVCFARDILFFTGTYLELIILFNRFNNSSFSIGFRIKHCASNV